MRVLRLFAMHARTKANSEGYGQFGARARIFRSERRPDMTAYQALDRRAIVRRSHAHDAVWLETNDDVLTDNVRIGEYRRCQSELLM